jgi:hypothetical protein
VLIQEKTLPAISNVVGAGSESDTCMANVEAWYGDGAKGLTGVAVDDRDKTAKIREMYRMVFGEGIGELDTAIRRICGFGEDPTGGEFCQDSWPGVRAKLGIRKAFIGLD